MKSTKDWNVILIVLLCIAAIIIYDLGCNGTKPHQIVKTDTVVTYTHQVDTFYKERLVPLYRTHIDTFKSIDTAYVVKEYNTINVYSDTLLDSNYNVIILDTLFQNKIYSRRAVVNVTHKNTVITNTVSTRNQWFVGGQISAPQFSISPTIHYQRNKDMYGLGVNPFTKSIIIGYSRKIY